MSRLQTGALQLVMRAVALEEVVPAALAGLSQAARVDADVPETLPRVNADPALLERAIANVVENAGRHGRLPTSTCVSKRVSSTVWSISASSTAARGSRGGCGTRCSSRSSGSATVQMAQGSGSASRLHVDSSRRWVATSRSTTRRGRHHDGHQPRRERDVTARGHDPGAGRRRRAADPPRWGSISAPGTTSISHPTVSTRSTLPRAIIPTWWCSTSGSPASKASTSFGACAGGARFPSWCSRCGTRRPTRSQRSMPAPTTT